MQHHKLVLRIYFLCILFLTRVQVPAHLSGHSHKIAMVGVAILMDRFGCNSKQSFYHIFWVTPTPNNLLLYKPNRLVPKSCSGTRTPEAIFCPVPLGFTLIPPSPPNNFFYKSSGLTRAAWGLWDPCVCHGRDCNWHSNLCFWHDTS